MIRNAISAAFEEYSKVMLDLSGTPAGLSGSVTPGSYVGAYDRSIERTFNFTVEFTGLAPGTYSFDDNALVDGGIVAVESDTITVTGGEPVPEPSTGVLLGAAVAGLALLRRYRRKAA